MQALTTFAYAVAAFCAGLAFAVHPATRPVDRDAGRDQAAGGLTAAIFFLFVAVILTWAR